MVDLDHLCEGDCGQRLDCRLVKLLYTMVSDVLSGTAITGTDQTHSLDPENGRCPLVRWIDEYESTATQELVVSLAG